MKFLYSFLLCSLHLHLLGMSLQQSYQKALNYIFMGNSAGLKQLVIKHQIDLGKAVICHSPLMHHLAYHPHEDIEHTQDIFRHINETTDITLKDSDNATILHKAAEAKNTFALATLSEHKQFHQILYEQDSYGRTPLFNAGINFYDSERKILRNSGATIAVLKYAGYSLENDPLYKKHQLPNGIVQRWLDNEKLEISWYQEGLKAVTQHFLKQKIQKIISSIGCNSPIRIHINKYSGLACARRYGEVQCIDISPEIEHFVHKKPLILHQLAYHLLGYSQDLEKVNYADLFLKDFQQREDQADDFVMKICPQEFMDYCQFCLENSFPSGFRSFQERKKRTGEYLKHRVQDQNKL